MYFIGTTALVRYLILPRGRATYYMTKSYIEIINDINEHCVNFQIQYSQYLIGQFVQSPKNSNSLIIFKYIDYFI